MFVYLCGIGPFAGCLRTILCPFCKLLWSLCDNQSKICLLDLLYPRTLYLRYNNWKWQSSLARLHQRSRYLRLWCRSRPLLASLEDDIVREALISKTTFLLLHITQQLQLLTSEVLRLNETPLLKLNKHFKDEFDKLFWDKNRVMPQNEFG